MSDSMAIGTGYGYIWGLSGCEEDKDKKVFKKQNTNPTFKSKAHSSFRMTDI